MHLLKTLITLSTLACGAQACVLASAMYSPGESQELNVYIQKRPERADPVTVCFLNQPNFGGENEQKDVVIPGQVEGYSATLHFIDSPSQQDLQLKLCIFRQVRQRKSQLLLYSMLATS